MLTSDEMDILVSRIVPHIIEPLEISTVDHVKTLAGIVKNEGSPKWLWLDGVARALHWDATMTCYRQRNLLATLLEPDGPPYVLITPISVQLPPIGEKPYIAYDRNR